MNKLSKVAFVSASLISSFLIFSSIALAAPPSERPLSQGASRSATAKLKSCQARENAIKVRSDQLTKLTTNMEEKFDSIAQRVEDYYNSKVVPSGKTVSNYNNLVSDISTKKAAVQTALNKAKDNLASFSCSTNDPKGQMTTFRKDMQTVKKALKDFRTSIKNLIVAVHSVTGAQNREGTNSAKGGKH